MQRVRKSKEVSRLEHGNKQARVGACPADAIAQRLPCTCDSSTQNSDIEYFFTDTGKELPEVYEYLGRLEGFLGRPILRLNPDRDFDFWLKPIQRFSSFTTNSLVHTPAQATAF